VRCDSGIYSGYEVTPYYDPILAKLIVRGESREVARRRMIHALEDYVILGIPTTIGFLHDLLAHPDFASGNTHTHFIDQHFPHWQPGSGDSALLDIALVAGAWAGEHPAKPEGRTASPQRATPWQSLGKWEIGGA
jgi:acetyl/propionyl-CoA carboxylase alpha subunit